MLHENLSFHSLELELKPETKQQHANSIIHRMPVEIASAIFELYVHKLNHPTNRSEPRKINSPLLLGAICQTWRHIAWSTPRLWTSLTMDFTSVIGETQIQIAIEWLYRSGQLPLSINFYRHVGSNFDTEISYPLIEALNMCSARWYSLALYLPSTMLLRISDSQSTSSILRHLGVASYGPVQGTFDMTNSMPTTVTIDCLPLQSFNIRWNNITHISTFALFLDEVLEILRRAPQLASCKFESVDGGRDVSSPVNRLILPHLKTLFIQICDASGSIFFECVSLPALTSLTIGLYEQEIPTEVLVSFLLHSSCTLKGFSIQEAIITGQDLIQLAKAAPSPTSFHLYPYETEELDLFYYALSTLPVSESQVIMKPLLPSLQSFCLEGGHTFPWEYLPSFFYPFHKAELGGPRRPLNRIEITCQHEEKDDHVSCIPEEILFWLHKLMEKDETISLKFEASLHGGTAVNLIELAYQSYNQEEQREMLVSEF